MWPHLVIFAHPIGFFGGAEPAHRYNAAQRLRRSAPLVAVPPFGFPIAPLLFQINPRGGTHPSMLIYTIDSPSPRPRI